MVSLLEDGDMTPIRLLIVDDAARVRQDLRTMLSLAGDAEKDRLIEIVGEAANGLEAIRQAESLRPQVVLMDLEMPVLDGYEAARQIKTRCPSCQVIALTIHDYEAVWQRATQAGVDDFVVKGAPLETLIQAILGRKE
jgi:DNA-binding NarL/FixJ family response regulator